MSNGYLTKPAELDAIENRLKDITLYVAQLTRPMDDWERRLEEAQRLQEEHDSIYSIEGFVIALVIVLSFACFFALIGRF